jgi:hypothetical protein
MSLHALPGWAKRNIKLSRLSVAAVMMLALALQPFAGVQQAAAATTDITQIVFVTPAQTLGQGQASDVLEVHTINEAGDREPVTRASVSLEFTSTSPTGQFSNVSPGNGECTGNWNVTSLQLTNNQSEKGFCYKDSTPGEHVLTVSAAGQAWLPAEQPVTIVGNDDEDENSENENEDESEQEEQESIDEPTLVTEVVSGDTAEGYNQPGWLFNRDTNTSTPFEFNDDQASIGEGSLHVLPIGEDPADKFIAEYFYLDLVDDFNSISYDFLIGSGGVESDAKHFYLNVYTNLPESDPNNFYDCRFDFVPSVGSLTDFTTFTVDKATTAAHVQGAGCPTATEGLGGLPAGSTIRAFSINVGDTSANDQGLDGYLDNVVVSRAGLIATYDFEPASTDETSDNDESGSTGGRGTLGEEFPTDTIQAVSQLPTTHNLVDNNLFGDSTADGTDDEGGQVLADEDEQPIDETQASDEEENGCATFFGACWYWWIAGLGVVGGVYALLRYLRGRES